MDDIQKMLQKFSTAAALVEEREDTSGTSIFVEFVLEKRQMLGNFQEFENQVGKMRLTHALFIIIFI